MTLTYGSVCSGIEAASLAWESLGLKPAWFAEIEDFPSAVLAHRWPQVNNLGDMTQIAARILAGEIDAPDILVGGTPCQAFSIAGLRQGLDDARGQLTLKFVELANAIDTARAAKGLPPCIIIWENVPGVLSSHDNAFGNFIAALAGELEAFEPGDRPETGKSSQYWTWSKSARQHVAKWTKHGCVTGGQRGLAWAVKDAQYFGVAQRRRRTFVVASARTDFDPGTVFFEPESVCRDTPPSRKAGQDAAAVITRGAGVCSHWDDPDAPHPTLSQSFNTGSIGQSDQEVFSQRGAGIVTPMVENVGYRMLALGLYKQDETASCCKARDYKEATDLTVRVCYGLDEEQNGADELMGTLKSREKGGGFEGTVAYCEPIVMAHGQGGAEVNAEGTAPTLTCNHEAPIVSFPANMSGTQFAAGDGDVCQTICAKNPTAIAFTCKDHGQDAGEEISPTLRAGGHNASHASGGVAPAVCIPIHDKATRYKGGGDGRENDGSQNGLGIGKDADPCPTLDTSCNHAVAYGFQPRIARNGRGDMGDCCHTLSAESGTTGKGDSAPCVATYTAPAIGHFKADDVSSTLTRSAGQGNGETQNGAFVVNAEPTAMAFAENDRNEVRYIDGDGQITAPVQCGGGKPGQGYQAVVEMPQMSVRRLTPYECELLQGMPGDHTLIPTGKYKKLIDDELAYLRYHAPELPEDMLMKMAADGPRYKAIGNSMAVPVMRWIMERILLQVQPADHVEDFGNDEPPAPDVKPKAKKVKQKVEKVKLPPEYTRSPLKWAGGKYLLLKELLNAMPPGVRLVEPFVGGGSVFLNAGLKNQFSRFLLADINADLVNLYQMLAIVPQQVTDAARVFYADFNTPQGYQTVKDAFNAHDMDAVTRAAAFLFINRHCFNGLIRYNQQGIFNVGYGKYEAPYFPESEIVDFIRVAPSCVFLNAGFEKTLALAGAGDVVYCDPPYEPMPGKDGFTGYAAGGFKWEQQEALAQACVDAHKRGAEVLITNSGAPKILELYMGHGMKVQDINAKRSISSKGSTRETATDILATLIHERTDES